MELGFVFAAGLTLCWMPFPFLTALIALTVWHKVFGWWIFIWGNDCKIMPCVSMFCGIACVFVAFGVERRMNNRAGNGINSELTKEHCEVDFAFWIYLVGAFAFWTGLEDTHIHSELDSFCNSGSMLDHSPFSPRDASLPFLALWVLRVVSFI